ncbi:MAG: hypothetical protein RI918_1681 [Pseudomonadota bacterium]
MGLFGQLCAEANEGITASAAVAIKILRRIKEMVMMVSNGYLCLSVFASNAVRTLEPACDSDKMANSKW